MQSEQDSSKLLRYVLRKSNHWIELNQKPLCDLVNFGLFLLMKNILWDLVEDQWARVSFPGSRTKALNYR